jgi:2-keto-4-pentenoate hydratase/2-oxohepta-3-ene-1,7-dioic acid hydratase in catechol pathway
MADLQFKLATVCRDGGKPFATMVLGEQAFDLARLHETFQASPQSRRRSLSATESLQALLDAWDPNFAVLQEMAAFVAKEGANSHRFQALRAPLSALRFMAPILKPSKMLYAAANFPGHVSEMRKSGFGNSAGIDRSKDSALDKSKGNPYMFLKAPSTLAGAYDDILLPEGMKRIDWEGELALAIGLPGRRIRVDRAIEHVAGFMTTNDVSCRDLQFRDDRPTIRSDWLGGKSHDTFAPMGPFFVPRAFVPDHMALRIVLSVNGVVKQDGLIGDIIFTPEEQIEYASRTLTLESGDVIAAGTIAGVGQGMGQFLAAGDIVETEVTGLGKQRNRVVDKLG